ncbi:MAG: sialidase family protein, partial [Candidatus Geothermarchaeales archaeon]
VSSIAVANSGDGGLTWKDPRSSARSLVTLTGQFNSEGFFEGQVKQGFLDKPWLAIGPSSSDQDTDVIYVTYTKFETVFDIDYLDVLPIFVNPVVESVIELVSSSDGGQTWTEPVKVSPVVRRTFGGTGGNRVVQGSQPAVAPDGSLYVAWVDSTDDDSFEGVGEIHIARSDDDGRSFTIDRTAAIILELGFRSRSANFRSWGAVFPQLTVGPTGEVYAVYTEKPADDPSDDGDIYFLKSLDRGESWSSPRKLNDDDTNRFQFFPAIDVSPSGKIHVMWGDTRDDPREAAYHIYYTTSDDGGETWGFELEEIGLRFESARVTDFPSNPNFGFPRGRFIGDYFSIKATEDDAYLVWADTRLGEFGAQNQKIGFARLRAVRSPSIFISPPSGSGGAEVTIVGFDFQPEQTFFIQLEDDIISSGRTNKEGGFTTRLFIPVSSEGTHNVFAFDESGNFGTASFFTEFGFDTVKKRLEGTSQSLADQLADLEGKLQGLSPSDGSSEFPLVDLDELAGRVNLAVEEAIDDRLPRAGQSGEAGLGEIVTMMWVTVGVAIVAIILATTSIVLQRKRR